MCNAGGAWKLFRKCMTWRKRLELLQTESKSTGKGVCRNIDLVLRALTFTAANFESSRRSQMLSTRDAGTPISH